jgi:hypothetical protein
MPARVEPRPSAPVLRGSLLTGETAGRTHRDGLVRLARLSAGESNRGSATASGCTGRMTQTAGWLQPGQATARPVHHGDRRRHRRGTRRSTPMSPTGLRRCRKRTLPGTCPRPSSSTDHNGWFRACPDHATPFGTLSCRGVDVGIPPPPLCPAVAAGYVCSPSWRVVSWWSPLPRLAPGRRVSGWRVPGCVWRVLPPPWASGSAARRPGPRPRSRPP